LFGPGKQISESISTDGLKTQVFEYITGDRRVNVTYVEGLVVRYSITSISIAERLYPAQRYVKVECVYHPRPTTARRMNGLPACCCR
jgi:hypothetical protein